MMQVIILLINIFLIENLLENSLNSIENPDNKQDIKERLLIRKYAHVGGESRS